MGFQGCLFAQLDHFNDYEATYPSGSMENRSRRESSRPRTSPEVSDPYIQDTRHPLGRRGTPMDKRRWSRGQDGWRGLNLSGQLEGEDVSRLDLKPDRS